MAPCLLPLRWMTWIPQVRNHHGREMRCGPGIRLLSRVSDYIVTGVWHKTLSEPGFNLGMPPSIRASLGGKQWNGSEWLMPRYCCTEFHFGTRRTAHVAFVSRVTEMGAGAALSLNWGFEELLLRRLDGAALSPWNSPSPGRPAIVWVPSHLMGFKYIINAVIADSNETY